MWVFRAGWQTARQGVQVKSEAASAEHRPEADELRRCIAQLETTLQTVRASEEQLKDTIESANDIIYSHDFQGNLISVNAAGLRLYEYTPEEIASLNVAQIVDPDYLPVAQRAIRELLRNKNRQGSPCELLTRTRTGRRVWVEVNLRLLERDGRPFAVQGIARDITGRSRPKGPCISAPRSWKPCVRLGWS